MRKAARLLGKAAASLAEAGVLPQSYMARHVDADRETVRAALGEEAFAAEWEAGGRMSADQIIAFALGEEV